MAADAKIRLAQELQSLRLIEMSDLAVRGHYSDFESPLALPKVSLCEHILGWAKIAETPERRAKLLELRKRVMEGEFDG